MSRADPLNSSTEANDEQNSDEDEGTTEIVTSVMFLSKANK
jgi:hypothetical protein|tara:strand:+ start:516 stop:638 length:123 start_codon:yes stop_codon:yes gene_type:complete